jgi:hypothetical protein
MTIRSNIILNETMQKVVDYVIEQVVEDLDSGDCTAIAELLSKVPMENLLGFLSEETRKRLELMHGKTV